jgi:hypothetical protein
VFEVLAITATLPSLSLAAQLPVNPFVGRWETLGRTNYSSIGSLHIVTGNWCRRQPKITVAATVFHGLKIERMPVKFENSIRFAWRAAYGATFDALK